MYLAENNFSTYRVIKSKENVCTRLEDGKRPLDRIELWPHSGGRFAQRFQLFFCTNGSSSAGIYSIPIGFGPGREQEAHTVNSI